jgi:hypothetical protein
VEEQRRIVEQAGGEVASYFRDWTALRSGTLATPPPAATPPPLGPNPRDPRYRDDSIFLGRFGSPGGGPGGGEYEAYYCPPSGSIAVRSRYTPSDFVESRVDADPGVFLLDPRLGAARELARERGLIP